MASPLSTFHLFPNLPAELQARIWKEAAYDEKRMVKLSIRGDALLVTDAPVPKLFLVNKDVYNILKIFYTRFLNGQLFPTYSPAQQGPLFSFEYDIFLIDWDYWDIALIIHDVVDFRESVADLRQGPDREDRQMFRTLVTEHHVKRFAF